MAKSTSTPKPSQTATIFDKQVAPVQEPTHVIQVPATPVGTTTAVTTTLKAATQATTPVTATPPTDIQKFQYQLEKYESNVLPNLLKKHGIDVLQFKQIVLSEIKKNKKLLEAFVANPSSMFASILAGAEIGLVPSDMLGEFYLIPRNLKQDNGSYLLTVTPLLGYKGLVSVLLRSGDITRIHTEVVYEGDVFEPSYGLEPNIIHKPNYDTPRTAEKITHAYAVAKSRNGEYQFHIMTRAEIKAVQAMAKVENDLYFNDKKSPNRWMERKAVLIQLGKLLPKDYYSKKALNLASSIEGGGTIALDDTDNVIVLDGKKFVPAHQSSLNGIKELPDIPE